MKIYCRQIENISILVHIDKTIYNQFNQILDCFFITFSNTVESLSANLPVHSFYIISKEDAFKHPKDRSFVISDHNPRTWVFDLLNDLEVFYEEVLNCTMLHGSCIKLNEKNILILGERWSGKTTLTYFLTDFCGGEYVSDDCVYILNHKYIGFCMPLPLREMAIRKQPIAATDSVITHTHDAEDNQRILVMPHNRAEQLDSIDVVLFPHYVEHSKGAVTEIPAFEIYTSLLRNVRNICTIKEMCSDIQHLTINCKAYRLEYPSCRKAYEMLSVNSVV